MALEIPDRFNSRSFPPSKRTSADYKTIIQDMMKRLISYVPKDVEVGFHLCYGDATFEHFTQVHKIYSV